ncbi:MAG: P-type conjugative transfer protein TrbJ [Sphingopyxis sp.]|nr:P-type conjugative transfer protein TrbJ [Sphingopyxis sp.]
MKSPSLLSVLAAGAALFCVGVTAVVPTVAQAQLGGIVHDPRNYAQNIMTAARTLEQINNQIRQLQNQATSLVNEARNLQSLPLTVIEPLQVQIRQTQALLGQAQRVAYDVRQIEREFQSNYRSLSMTGPQRMLVQGAEARWQNSVGAFEDAMRVQAGAVDNIEGSRQSIDRLVSASQSATGALQAAQAGNQLLAVQAQQLADLTATVAALGRAQSLDAAQRAAAQAQAREQLRRFLGERRPYVPGNARMFGN